jgi:hypothetical protein
MHHLTRFIYAGLALAAALLFGAASAVADEQDHHGHAFQVCAKACDDCARSCESCATHCANMLSQGKKDHLKTLQTCRDCATTCSAASAIVARSGPFSDTICQACAEVCKRCGDACEKFEDDPHMKKCAEECRKCEKACRDMLKHVGHKESTGEK